MTGFLTVKSDENYDSRTPRIANAKKKKAVIFRKCKLYSRLFIAREKHRISSEPNLHFIISVCQMENSEYEPASLNQNILLKFGKREI